MESFKIIFLLGIMSGAIFGATSSINVLAEVNNKQSIKQNQFPVIEYVDSTEQLELENE
jgi:hypothetical protein